MATPTTSDDIRDIVSLHERTNYTTHTNTVSRKSDQSRAVKPARGSLRRSQSSRRFTLAFNSSETLSSSSDRVCDAEIISENTSPPVTPLNHEQTGPLSPSLAPFSMSPVFQLSLPHSGWPPTELQPIIERDTQGHLHGSASLPKLGSSPERRSDIVRPVTSIQSIHPAISDSSPIQGHDKQHVANRFRSFSLNDLDCLPKSDIDEAWPRRFDQRSSSSDEILKFLCKHPIFPLRPVHSPPYRSPTPPGLPSFRTREAEEYRLTPSSPPNRVVALLQRWLGSPSEETDDRLSIASNPLSSQTSPVLPSSSLSPPASMLKRVLGATRLVDFLQQGGIPRSRLPAGIRVAALPGPLIQADDGTWVRGRWTSRVSSHGVGTRPLDQHPIARAAGLHSIDEAVRDIDKACQAADEHNASRRMDTAQASPRATSENSDGPLPVARPRCESSRQSWPNQGVRRIGTFESTLAAERQMSQSPFTPLIHDRRSMSNRSLQSPVGMDGLLSTEVPVQQASVPQDSLAGFREYVEQGEREQARQSLADRKEKRHRGKECWEGFWTFCCCMPGSTDESVVS